MPRLDPVLERTVYFAFGQHPKSGNIVGPRGTGVIVSRESNAVPGLVHYYAVTNHHVAVSGNLSMLRVNTCTGSRLIHYDAEQWLFCSGGHDLAAIDITDEIDRMTDEIEAIPESLFVTEQFISQVSLGLGEDVFMIGMFSNYSGGNRNAPIARFGHVARIADVRTPIKHGFYGPQPTHLVDMHSRTGFSGSPVFVFRTPSGCLEGALDFENHGWVLSTIANLFVRLLGIHFGQYNEIIKAQKCLSDDALIELIGDPINDGDELSIPSSVSTVVPAYMITRLLD